MKIKHNRKRCNPTFQSHHSKRIKKYTKTVHFPPINTKSDKRQRLIKIFSLRKAMATTGPTGLSKIKKQGTANFASCSKSHVKQDNKANIQTIFEGLKSNLASKQHINGKLLATTITLNSLLEIQAANIKMEMKELLQQKISKHVVKESPINCEARLKEQYLIKLPIKFMEEYNCLNTKLLDEAEARKYFTNILMLKYGSGTLTKKVTVLLKAVFTRDLIVNFTATKNVKGKTIFCGSPIANIIFDVIFTKENGELTFREFNQALSTVIPNAKDWEGNRRRREKKES